jgi:hypothetical protein
MAGGVADRDQDRAVAPLGFCERGFAPRAPMDGIMGVLEEVGRSLAYEEIAVGLDDESLRVALSLC